MFIIGLIFGVIVTLSVVTIILPRQMFLVDESNFSFEDTVEKIIQSSTKNNWSIPNQYDLQATMKKNGFEVMPVKIISMCQPNHASKILGGNEERLVSAMMPCRVAVYKKENGNTYVSRLNAKMFSKLMNKKIKDIMGEVAIENEAILNSVIKNN